MQGIKRIITNLKSKWDEKIQETNDIFGYPGISKENVKKSLEESYNLLSGLEQYEQEFEVILLKRNIRDALETAKWYINDGISEPTSREKFNDFLNAIFQIRFLIKQTYLIVQDTSIRTEAEIHALHESKKKLDDLMGEYSKSAGTVKEQYETTESMLVQIETNVKNINERHDLVEQQATNIIARGEKIESIYNKIEGWDDDILEHQKSIKSIASDIKTNQEEIDSALTAVGEMQKKQQEDQDLLEKQIRESNENIKKSSDILGKANVAGMAGSFKKRKDELFVPLIFWGIVFILTIVGLILSSKFLMEPFLELIKGENRDIRELILHLGFLSPLIWLGWMSAKQYGYIARLWEDYSFKYAISMAFEGYKSATKDVVSDAMKEDLLRLTVKNISDNPIRLYDSKSNHGTPIQELLNDSRELIISARKSFFGWIPSIVIKPSSSKEGNDKE